ncbi:RNA recognition domain-containing protein [Phlyctema vagabunda]|uniref:Nucleolar protein 12 n=1 Tax=Phlyctema vagabunda TaxID=108571 RepID=A0ABR4P326_9HELO
MGKRIRKEEKANGSGETKNGIFSDTHAVDPTLASLFASSAGPVVAPPKSRYQQAPPAKRTELGSSDEEEESASDDEDEDEELSSVDGDLEDSNVLGDLADSDDDEDDSEEPQLDNLIDASANKPERKRKRNKDDEDLEGKYLQKLAREEEREEEERQAERRLKRQKIVAKEGGDAQDKAEEEAGADTDDEVSEEEESGSEETPATSGRAMPSDVPQHESLAPDKDAIELEKASRTVFLANVSTLAISSKSAKKTLLAHMASFIDSLPAPPEGKPSHKVESLRFRSTAYAGAKLPKKAAFAKKELMEATTKSTNAYVVYSTAYAAREAAKRLNGTMILDRHLRVDGVAHPAKTDHRRCVFVGNLGFVDDESLIDQGGENERKRSKIPSDIEEGLWRQFGKAGTVESVRVVRDEKTRVGKGFAYVQFQDANAVEAALLFNEKKYPPMLPRVLRVVRAKAVRKTALASQQARPARPIVNNSGNANRTPIYNPKMTPQQSSLQGRAGKLLGRAGAAQFGKRDAAEEKQRDIRPARNTEKSGLEGLKTPESIVFEGYRASAKSGKPKDLKMGGGGGKKKGKPRTRSSKRASDWKKGGGKK